MKECASGGKVHERCEEVEFEGSRYVVCHDCEQTLGRSCEVYSRVVGYLRPTDQWNKGKREEFKGRKTFGSGI